MIFKVTKHRLKNSFFIIIFIIQVIKYIYIQHMKLLFSTIYFTDRLILQTQEVKLYYVNMHKNFN